MNLTITYILSQVFIIITYILLAVSYRLKTRNAILICNFISLITASLSYLFLKAYTGLAMEIVAITRNAIFIHDEEKNKNKKIAKRDVFVLLMLFTISICFTIFTYNSFFSLMPLFATLLYTYSIWQKNTEVYKWLGIPVGIFGIIYFIYIKSLFGIILESFLLIFNAFGLLKEKIIIQKSRIVN